MTFADLVAQESILLDANTFVYEYASNQYFGAAANQLLTRVEKSEVTAFTSTHVLTETARRLMVIEATAAFGWATKVLNRLQAQPTQISKLTAFRRAIDAILQSRVQVLTISPQLVAEATVVSQKHGLLSSDAMIVAVMEAHGLKNLASNDADFDRVPWLVRYGPI